MSARNFKNGTYYLGRVVKGGLLDQEKLIDAIRNAETISSGKFKWTIGEVVEGSVGDYPYIYGELMKYSDRGEVAVVDEVNKVENDLGEFIVEQKELIKYMETYPYSPKSFSIKYITGEKYSGYFSPDWVKEIFGEQINPDGSKYRGFYKNGKFEGRGRLILPKGDYYEGEFKNNKANGFGKYVNIKT